VKFAGTFSKQARQANEPIVTGVMVKGDRMLPTTKDRSEVINLDAGTIMEIDHVKRQYTVMTFEQMRQQMETAAARPRPSNRSSKSKPQTTNPRKWT
jgi:hypothetical protein